MINPCMCMRPILAKADHKEVDSLRQEQWPMMRLNLLTGEDELTYTEGLKGALDASC